MHPSAPYLLLVLGFLLLTNPSFSQSKNIKGQVVIFNSKAQNGKIQFVENAKISSPISGAVHSDEKGRFKLKLKQVYDGQPIFFQVNKDDYQVVDHKSLQYSLIDKKPRLRISIAKKGFIKNLRGVIASVARKALLAEEEELLDLLAFGGASNDHAIKTVGKRAGRKVFSTFDAEELVDEMSEKVEEQIRFSAYELAIVNHDFASNFWISAMESYNQIDLDATIKKLQEENVDQLAEEIISKIEKVKNRPSKVDWIILNKLRELETIKDNYTFQIIAYQQSLRLAEADLVLKKLAKINAVAPSHKHTQILDKLSFFQIIEPIQEDVDIVLQNTKKPVKNIKETETPAADSSIEIEEKESKIVATEITEQPTEEIKTKNAISNDDEIVLENQSETIAKEKQSMREQKTKRSSIVVKEISSSPTPASYIRHPKKENRIPANIVRAQTQSVPVQNEINQSGLTTRIVITISTSNEAPHTTTPNSNPEPIQLANPQPSKVVETITQIEPVQTYNELLPKGETPPPAIGTNPNDFENVLFNSKIVKRNFDAFIKQNEKAVPTKVVQ